MQKSNLLSFLVILAIPWTFATPIDQDITTLAEETGFGVSAFDYPADFDHQEYKDDISHLDQSFVGSVTPETTPIDSSTLEKRISDKDKRFQIYRMTYHNKQCPPMGGGCIEFTADYVMIDSDCHGGRCDAKHFLDFSESQHLCDKPFKACGIEYQIKYSGNDGSCMRHKFFWRRKALYWTKYGNLVRNGKVVGDCRVWNDTYVGKYCSGNAWGMESQIRCWIKK
jgi:hypothetical protein